MRTDRLKSFLRFQEDGVRWRKKHVNDNPPQMHNKQRSKLKM